MAATEGNEWWKLRATSGREKTFSSSGSLWESACEYFQWVEDNPLKESKLFKVKNSANLDEIVSENVSKMRAMTIDGLCLYLDVSVDTWSNYRSKEGYEDFFGVVKKVESVIRSQKFAGAAADLLNANIIARDLGLKDSTSNEHSGPNGGPIGIKAAVVGAEMTNEEASNVYKELMG